MVRRATLAPPSEAEASRPSKKREAVLCSGRADIISIARVLVADPDILQRTARGAKLRSRGREHLPSERQPPKA